MAGTTRIALLAGFMAMGLAGASRPCLARTSNEYSSPEDLWEHYCHMVGTRDEVEVLACYHEDYRNQLTGDKTAAGRARLGVHMSEMFELLYRDYDYQVADQKEEKTRTVYTVRFKNRKKRGEEFNSQVIFVEADGRWWIMKPPEVPGFLQASSGTFTMVAGVVIALAALGVIVKKALG